MTEKDCISCARILANTHWYPSDLLNVDTDDEDCGTLIVKCEDCGKAKHRYSPSVIAEATEKADEANLNTFKGKSCLIIGHGPSIDHIDMQHSYAVDVVIGVHDALHKDTQFVCSKDTETWWQYEGQVHRYKPHIKLVLHPVTCRWQPPNALYWQPPPVLDHPSSGVYACAWAAASGFTTIYTAGIDNWAPQASYLKRDKEWEEGKTCSLNTLTWFPIYLPPDVLIYKSADISRITCPVRPPPETEQQRREHDESPLKRDTPQELKLSEEDHPTTK